MDDIGKNQFLTDFFVTFVTFCKEFSGLDFSASLQDRFADVEEQLFAVPVVLRERMKNAIAVGSADSKTVSIAEAPKASLYATGKYKCDAVPKLLGFPGQFLRGIGPARTRKARLAKRNIQFARNGQNSRADINMVRGAVDWDVVGLLGQPVQSPFVANLLTRQVDKIPAQRNRIGIEQYKVIVRSACSAEKFINSSPVVKLREVCEYLVDGNPVVVEYFFLMLGEFGGTVVATERGYHNALG